MPSHIWKQQAALKYALGHHRKYRALDLPMNLNGMIFYPKTPIVKDRHVQIATEGVLIGSIIEHGISKHLVIVSDDAGQFNVLLHALCWIHANRAIDKIIPYTDRATKDLDTVKDQVWQLYILTI